MGSSFFAASSSSSLIDPFNIDIVIACNTFISVDVGGFLFVSDHCDMP